MNTALDPETAPTQSAPVLARRLREELEGDILNLVRDFELQTGCKVAKLTIKRGDLPYYVGATVFL